jgi:hypothetical protein
MGAPVAPAVPPRDALQSRPRGMWPKPIAQGPMSSPNNNGAERLQPRG